MKKKIWIISSIVLVAVLAVVSYIKYDSSSKERHILEMIGRNKDIVNYYCSTYKLEPRVYISAVYGELFSNYDFFDGFDHIRAEYGFDPSAGFGQMKVSTLMWLEENYSGTGPISKSRDRNEIVHKLLNDTINIAYSAFYVRLIYDKLMGVTGGKPTIKQIGSYYSIGINHHNRKINKNTSTPVGINAEKFYYSENLLDVYPKNQDNIRKNM